VVKVVPADAPMQVAVLVDTCDVAREQIPYLRDAVPAFVNTLISDGARNQVAIVGFGERPTILADYTSSSAVLKKAIDRIWANRMSGPYLLISWGAGSIGRPPRADPDCDRARRASEAPRRPAHA
jgi:hypothetical protein